MNKDTPTLLRDTPTLLKDTPTLAKDPAPPNDELVRSGVHLCQLREAWLLLAAGQLGMWVVSCVAVAVELGRL